MYTQKFLCFVIKYLYVLGSNTQHTRSAFNPFNSCCTPEQRVRTSTLNLGDSDSTHTPLTTHTLAFFKEISSCRAGCCCCCCPSSRSFSRPCCCPPSSCRPPWPPPLEYKEKGRKEEGERRNYV